MSNYTPPAVWDYQAVKDNMGGAFGSINRPTAGARHEQTLPRGDKPLQLYTLNTPNGLKVNILLEELKALGKAADYDAFKIDISQGDQFGSDFVAINPNSKIPALLDRSEHPPLPVFESGAILIYLAEKYGAFLPASTAKRAQTLSWLMWQMGSAPFLGGGFGHFYVYAPAPIEYAIDRFAMEAKRQLDVLDKHLAENTFLSGDEYTIADIAVYPWYGRLVLGKVYVNDKVNAARFLQVDSYPHVKRWAQAIAARPAVQQGEALVLRALHDA